MEQGRLTFIGAAGDEDFGFCVETATEICLVMVLDSFTETKPALRVGIMIGSDRF